MPQAIHCLHCQKPVALPERLVGRKVRCPRCGEMFVATLEPEEEVLDHLEEVEDDEPPRRGRRTEERVQSAPPRRRSQVEEDEDRPRSRRRDSDEDDDDRPRRDEREDDEDEDDSPRRKKRKKGSWFTAYHGTTKILNALRIQLGGTIALVVAGFFIGGLGGAVARSAGNASVLLGGLFLIAALQFLLALGCQILWILGLLQCRSAPAKSGGRGLVTASLVMIGVSAFFQVVGSIPYVPSVQFLGGLSSLLWSAAMVVYLFFLRDVPDGGQSRAGHHRLPHGPGNRRLLSRPVGAEYHRDGVDVRRDHGKRLGRPGSGGNPGNGRPGVQPGRPERVHPVLVAGARSTGRPYLLAARDACRSALFGMVPGRVTGRATAVSAVRDRTPDGNCGYAHTADTAVAPPCYAPALRCEPRPLFNNSGERG